MSASTQTAYEWKDLPWKKFQKVTFKLQKRIYQASQRGDKKTVRCLQKLLVKSKAAAFLAVRKVSQDNQGKRTAGVDGIKSLTPSQRVKLVQDIHNNPYQKKAPPVRRVWIDKLGKDEKRPLGIPTMECRARQALAKMALEAEWEAIFEPNSYGFRPARSVHDAIGYIFVSIRECPKYILDTDIAKCFDKINHSALLEKVNIYPQMRRTIKAWLKAGILDGKELFPSKEGVPQGGVASPLLMNIALHGLENYITDKFSKRLTIPKGNKARISWKPQICRYADDLVVLHCDYEVIQQIKILVQEWLKPLGLKLKEEKTRITHTLWYGKETPGFDFLGFNIRQHIATKNQRPNSNSGKLNFVTKVRPSQAALKRQGEKIRTTIRKMKDSRQQDLISTLNPIIVGWGRYFSICVPESKAKLDNRLINYAIRRWAKRRHPRIGWKRVARKYWRLETGKWTFAQRGGVPLQGHYQSSPGLKPPGKRSPFDGDWAYWLTRNQKHMDISPAKAFLFRRQKGKCAFCKLCFQSEDIIEVDHIIPKRFGGLDINNNRQLLHRHCRDEKSRQEIVKIEVSTVNDQMGEELYAFNDARTVLKQR